MRLEIEHILAVSLAQNRVMNKFENVELLGNLALLEPAINKKASNFSFSDKIPHYTAAEHGTFNNELRHLTKTKTDFTEADILERNAQIINAVIELLKEHRRIG